MSGNRAANGNGYGTMTDSHHRDVKKRPSSSSLTLGRGSDSGASLSGSRPGSKSKSQSQLKKSTQPLVIIDDGKGDEEDVYRAQLAIGGMTCASCVQDITKELKAKEWVRDVTVNLIANSASIEFVGEGREKELVRDIVDTGYTAALDSVAKVNEKLWKASLAVGGMTCAKCAGAITDILQKKSWVRKVVVNLISNSATVEFVGKNHKDDIVESIEDAGYEAVLDSVQEVKGGKEEVQVEGSERTIEILIDGMYCSHCPGRLLAGLESRYGDEVEIAEGFGSENPILTITYTPEVPRFTIRHILETISAIEPSFQPSIYHPPTLEERSRNIHLREQYRILLRVILTFVIAIPTLIIGIIYMSLVSPDDPGRKFLMHPVLVGVSRAQWALFILSTPVFFLCADVFHIRALKELRSMWRRGSSTPLLQRFYRFGSMNMLMSLGTSIAYFSSIAQVVVSAIYPSLEPAESSFYFDSVVFLTFFLLIGRLIEAYSKSKTGDAVAMLGKLRPTTALLISTDQVTGEQLANGGTTESVQTVAVDLLELGDTVKILHGGSPPCDGTVVKGDTRFDESSLTGESRPVKKGEGDEVYSGTINKGSPVAVKVTGVGGSSMLDQIVKAVREGQTRRAPMERVADTLTAYFVPFVTLIAISTWIIWLSLGLSGALPDDYLEGESGGWVAWSLQFAIATFVVACPCGLALAAPTALFVGGGLAAKYGILAKGGGEAFEKASRLDCVVFDKTGTLTMGGEPVVTDHQLLDVKSASESGDILDQAIVLGMVQALEESSSHTVAKAIVTLCKSLETKSITTEEVEELPGKGMKATFNIPNHDGDTSIVIGNENLIADLAISIPSDTQANLESWKSQGRSVALAAILLPGSKSTWQLAATFSISDPIRPEAPFIIAALHRRKTAVWMLSGDNATTANAIGAQIGIPSSHVIAGVLPSQKAEKIQYLQRTLKARHSSGNEYADRRALVAMVGDGINDSPALTTADVGIAIGSGSDIAISSAEFVLVSPNLHSLITLLDLSKVVFRRIKFNFAWALVYNMVALPVAAGVLYPLRYGGQNGGGAHVKLDPVWASLAMALSSISVVCSSLLLRSKLPLVGFKAKRGDEGV